MVNIQSKSVDTEGLSPEFSVLPNEESLYYNEGKGYFGDSVAPRERIEASLDSLVNLSNIVDAEQARSRVKGAISLVRHVIENPLLSERTEVANITTQFAVALADIEYADNISSSGNDKEMHYYYMRGESWQIARDMGLVPIRSEGILRYRLLADEEKRVILDSFVESGPSDETLKQSKLYPYLCTKKIRGLDELIDVMSGDIKGTYVVMSDLSAEEILLVQEKIKELRIRDTSASIVIPVKYGSGLSGILVYGSYPSLNSRFSFESSDSSPPIQAINKVLLDTGLPFIPNPKAGKHTESQESPNNSSLFEGEGSDKALEANDVKKAFLDFLYVNYSTRKDGHVDRKVLSRKWSILLKGGAEQVDKLLELQEQYYQRAFVDGRYKGFYSGETILTRSGVSANETAFYLASMLTRGNASNYRRSYIHPGFYFENKPLIENHCYLSSTPESSNVFYVSDQPSYPLVGVREQEYEVSVNTLLQNVVASAEDHSDQVYVVVYDKTYDVNAKVLSDTPNLPPNIRVIETASLSKLQRGGRNFFYGTVFNWAPSEEQKFLAEARAMSKGVPFPETVVHFPHITPNEVHRDIANKRSFACKLKDYWKSLGIEHVDLATYNYFAYFYPSHNLISDSGPVISPSGWRDYWGQLESDLFEACRGPGLENGDSFGLKSARLSVPVDTEWLRDNILTNYLSPGLFPGYSYIRLAYGLDEANQQVLDRLKRNFHSPDFEQYIQ